jgi:phosphomannomutase
MIKEKLPCPSNKIPEVLKMVRERYSDSKLDLRDGVKVHLPNGWLHVRGSNTEPIIRLTAEAATDEEVRSIKDSIFEGVRRLINDHA